LILWWVEKIKKKTVVQTYVYVCLAYYHWKIFVQYIYSRVSGGWFVKSFPNSEQADLIADWGWPPNNKMVKIVRKQCKSFDTEEFGRQNYLKSIIKQLFLKLKWLKNSRWSTTLIDLGPQLLHFSSDLKNVYILKMTFPFPQTYFSKWQKNQNCDYQFFFWFSSSATQIMEVIF
jgi:hypothetical protein